MYREICVVGLSTKGVVSERPRQKKSLLVAATGSGELQGAVPSIPGDLRSVRSYRLCAGEDEEVVAQTIDKANDQVIYTALLTKAVDVALGTTAYGATDVTKCCGASTRGEDELLETWERSV